MFLASRFLGTPKVAGGELKTLPTLTSFLADLYMAGRIEATDFDEVFPATLSWALLPPFPVLGTSYRLLRFRRPLKQKKNCVPILWLLNGIFFCKTPTLNRTRIPVGSAGDAPVVERNEARCVQAHPGTRAAQARVPQPARPPQAPRPAGRQVHAPPPQLGNTASVRGRTL